MKRLSIKWRHLEINGKTCLRCSETGKELNKAINLLKEVAKPLGVEVSLEEEIIGPEDFKLNPLKSNEIWINGRLLEEWLGLKNTSTKCGDVCGDFYCRAVEEEGEVLEIIPYELIVRAGLRALWKNL